MFLNFLAVPQATDDEISGTSAAFARGQTIGAQAAQDADEQQANLAKQQEVDRTRLAQTNATQQGENQRKQLDQTKASNDAIYTTLHSGIAAKIADQQSKLESGNYNDDSQAALKSNLETNRQLLSSLEQQRQRQLTMNPEGHHSYEEKYYTAPDTPTSLQLANEVQQAKQGELASKYYGGLAAKRDYEDPNWKANAPGKPDKVTPKAEDTRDTFSNSVDLLPTKAQRVVDANRALSANPNDPALTTNYKAAVEDLQKTKDAMQTSWAGLVDRIQDGQFGQTAKDAWQETLSKLPSGTDPTLAQNHALVQAAILSRLGPLAEKKRKVGLTPAEEVTAARYNRLAEVIKADKDVTGAIKASTFEPDQSTQQGTNLQSLKAPLPLPVKTAVDSVYNSKYGAH